MKELFQCEKCGKVYGQRHMAVNCEEQPPEDVRLKVGDIVRTGHFGWFDGDKRWVVNPEVEGDHMRACPNGNNNCMEPCCCMQFYYVVTAIEEVSHRMRYHLFTKAMTGVGGYRGGYTHYGTHIWPEEVDNPPELKVDDLIGLKAGHLL